jgi:hypothetical protein
LFILLLPKIFDQIFTSTRKVLAGFFEIIVEPSIYLVRLGSLIDVKWRCPGCQTVLDVIPRIATCFCGKLDNPTYEPRGPPPHTCGEPCAKFRSRLALITLLISHRKKISQSMMRFTIKEMVILLNFEAWIRIMLINNALLDG